MFPIFFNTHFNTKGLFQVLLLVSTDGRHVLISHKKFLARLMNFLDCLEFYYTMGTVVAKLVTKQPNIRQFCYLSKIFGDVIISNYKMTKWFLLLVEFENKRNSQVLQPGWLYIKLIYIN